MQKSKICALLAALLLLLAGCGITEVEVIGGGVQNTLDKLHNAEYQGGPFENNLESARAYLLAQMQEKYGIKFAVAGEEELENYGAFAGATYTCRVAPLDAPEQVATALVSQSKYQAVRDDYAVYFFKAEAEAQAIRLCREREYVQAYEIALQMPQTESLANKYHSAIYKIR